MITVRYYKKKSVHHLSKEESVFPLMVPANFQRAINVPIKNIPPYVQRTC